MDSARSTAEYYKKIGAEGMRSKTNNERTRLILHDLRHILKKSDRILDVGCGYGRITIPLAKQGYRIVGVDISKNLLRVARSTDKGVSFKYADMRELPFKERSFDKIICIWSTFSELLTKKDQIKALQSMLKALDQNGMAVVDLPYVDDKKPHTKSSTKSRIAKMSIAGATHSSYAHTKQTLQRLVAAAGIRKSKILIKPFGGRRRLLLLFWKQ